MQLLIGLYILLLDQLTKHVLFDASLLNTGIGWGLLRGNVGLVTFLTAFVSTGVLLIVILHWSKLTAAQRLGAAAIVAGMASNLIDRVLYGGVIDPLNVGDWFPHFNLADGAIVVGLAILVFRTHKSRS